MVFLRPQLVFTGTVYVMFFNPNFYVQLSNGKLNPQIHERYRIL